MTSFGWLQIARLGLVQAALGAVVVLTTSTLNRVMVVELALPALLPGLLVALHYAVQLARPRMGHGSDIGGRRTPWIVGGMALLAGGGVLAALAVVRMGTDRLGGIALAVVAFAAIGVGVSASGTNLLVLLAKRVDAPRRAAAATIVWLMMIAGFAVTAGVAGQLLDPYSPERLLAVTAVVALAAFGVAVAALRGLEGPAVPVGGSAPSPSAPKLPFRAALALVWAEPAARQFTVFVFVSMLAYSAQDLILEPFAGTVFGYTPGESTQLSGVQHGGVLAGMLIAALAGSQLGGRAGGRQVGSLRAWTVGGCAASALALLGLVAAGLGAGSAAGVAGVAGGASAAGANAAGPAWPFEATVFALGVANGAFSIAAIGSMMRLAGTGHAAPETTRMGVRMGLWGAAQAIAFGFGGLLGTAASDLAQRLIASPAQAYAAVFFGEALLFVLAAVLAWRIRPVPLDATRSSPPASTNTATLLAATAR